MKTGMFKMFENLMVSATFAEKNQHDYAIQLMNADDKQKKSHQDRKALRNSSEKRPQMRL